MKIHRQVTRPAPFSGGMLTTSMCGRLNAASKDGMNLTTNPGEVTCAFCLQKMAALKREFLASKNKP
jgi:hypothetical protein